MSSDPQPSSQPSSRNPVFIGPPGPAAQAGFHGWFAPAAGSASPTGPTDPGAQAGPADPGAQSGPTGPTAQAGSPGRPIPDAPGPADPGRGNLTDRKSVV